MIDATVAQGVDQNSIDSAVSTAVAALADSAPETLNTLNELAAALGDDADFATSMTNALNTKLNAANNLSDVADAAAARSNLGLGTAATAATTSFATAAQGTKADNAATQADLTALETTISAGVATAAQGTLADGAIQKTDVSTGLVGSTSFAWPTTGLTKFNVNAEQIFAGPGRDPSYLYSYYGHSINACNSTLYAFALYKYDTPIKLYNWSDHTLYGEVTMPNAGYATTGYITMNMTETHLFVCIADTGNNINAIQNLSLIHI